MYDIWNFIVERTNHDCAVMIMGIYDISKHRDNLLYCLHQMDNIMREHRYQIRVYEEGISSIKPIYEVSKFMLYCNKNKMELNKF